MPEQHYDIIGDVHGCASQLRQLLGGLEYTVDPATGAYRHPQRRAVFVGDLIDRGREQREVLQLVKAMVDACCAAFGRIELIRIVKGKIERLRLHQEYVRDKVLKVTDLKHLAELYAQHG